METNVLNMMCAQSTAWDVLDGGNKLRRKQNTLSRNQNMYVRPTIPDLPQQ